MFLSDRDIVREIESKRITLKPFVNDQLQQASYDICLGNKFVVNDEGATELIDPVKKIYAKTREFSIKDGEPYILHPGISVLGTSKEFFGSDYYLIQLSGKSSLARIGLMVHNTAGLINPGHFLHVTFEITNQNNVPIVLRPSMKIAQVTFSMLSSPPSHLYSQTGRFAVNNWQHFIAEKKRNGKK
jgi:dCTP deaminase